MLWLRRFDLFLMAIIASALLASVLPATGAWIPIVAWATKLAIAALFFLYGARLSTRQALDGLRHWRLHATILSFTFVVFPLLGLALRVTVPTLMSPALYAGVLYLTLLPSTVQSSIAFTSIARGNVAGAIVSASASNLLGVVLTPLLCAALMTTSGVSLDARSVLDIVGQLLVPFALGQVLRPWIGAWVASHSRPLKLVDRGSIVLAVYSAFSEGMREGIWTQVSAVGMAALIGVLLVMLTLMLWLTWTVAVRLGFNREDVIAIQFCGTKKSLASGLPMALVLFAGQGVGLIVLPLILFHQAQLMACSALASRYAREAPAAQTTVPA